MAFQFSSWGKHMKYNQITQNILFSILATFIDPRISFFEFFQAVPELCQ